MNSKSEHLQIRLRPAEKAALRRRAAAAGQSVSEYVLSRALPRTAAKVHELAGLLASGAEHPYVLAELHDVLAPLGAGELAAAVEQVPVDRLSPFLANYVAAMVEYTCQRRSVPAPGWTARVLPLETPYFAAPLKSLRLHLLRASPVAFKRRNLFVDATVGARV